MAQAISGFKLYWFIFRYWLIGKTHCNIPNWGKKIAKFMCKVLWMFISFCIAACISKFFFGISLVHEGRLW